MLQLTTADTDSMPACLPAGSLHDGDQAFTSNMGGRTMHRYYRFRTGVYSIYAW